MRSQTVQIAASCVVRSAIKLFDKCACRLQIRKAPSIVALLGEKRRPPPRAHARARAREKSLRNLFWRGKRWFFTIRRRFRWRSGLASPDILPDRSRLARKYLPWRARSCAGSSSIFLQFETRGPGGCGIPEERNRNRVSVSKSICHSEFPESTRARACAQVSGHSESSIGRCREGVRLVIPHAVLGDVFQNHGIPSRPSGWPRPFSATRP